MAIRKESISANKERAEDSKCGEVIFTHSNVLLGGFYPYKDYLSIEFSNGAEFADLSGILEGKGKKRRHLKIVEIQDIDTKDVEAFVAKAVKN